MKLYLASLYSSHFSEHGSLFNRLTPLEKEYRLQVAHKLESYHYVGGKTAVEHMRRDQVRIFLDSGAFSAFTTGVTVDLNAYCRYVQENADIIEFASVLDCMGDPQATYWNQTLMERQGVRPLPCYHFNEDTRYLEHYIDNYDYITIGGMVPVSLPDLQIWLDEIWTKFLTDEDGRPKVKVHGFGLTSIPLMKRYPWYSVDSSSWVQLAMNGRVIHPDAGLIHVSNTTETAKLIGGHLDSHNPVQHEALRKMLEEPNIDIDRIREMRTARMVYNCWAYTTINNRINEANPEPRFIRQQEGLF